ncbi:MAG: sulfatase [Planctomycetales bacterium]|nr:sulfatase [Planctomycetales bacterium]
MCNAEQYCIPSAKATLYGCWQFRQLVFAQVLVFALAIVLANVANGRQPEVQPNIILIIADDLGYGELGCQGNPEIPTPRIDRLALSGVRCTQAYVTAPNCSPSRAGLFSGRIPTRFGYEFNPIGARNEDPGTGIPTSELLLPEQLQQVGYSTGLIGKWHLGGAADYHPLRRGFGEFFGFLHEGHYFAPSPWTGTTLMLRRKYLPQGSKSRYQVAQDLWYSSHMGHNEPAYDANNPITREGQPVVEQEYLTDALAREAVGFIRRYRQTPFFLSVTFNAVHSPLQAKNETLQKLSHINDLHRQIFAAMLVDLDRGVGNILDALDECELSQNTLVFFLSDNGGPTRELTSSNLPLRGGKGTMYEGGLRVPFIASWPGVIPAGETCDQVISSLDIYPTCAEVAGAASNKNLDGYSLLPLLKKIDPRSRHETLYWRQGNKAALRSGDWKIVASNRQGSLRDWELFDISNDMSETMNLADKHPQIVQQLRKRYEQLDAQMAEPLF